MLTFAGLEHLQHLTIQLVAFRKLENNRKMLNILKNWSNYEKVSLMKSKLDIVRTKKCGTLHDFACHPCAGAMLIFSVSFQF